MHPRARHISIFFISFFCVIVTCNVVISNTDQIPIVYGEWPPLSTKSMKKHGIATEIINAVLEEMHVSGDFRFQTWKKNHTDIKKNKVWAAYPYAKTEERENKFDYSDPIIYSMDKFFFFKKSPKANGNFEWNKLTDFKDYKLGGIIGFYYMKSFEDAKLNVTYTDKRYDALVLLAEQKVDYIILNELIGWTLIKHYFPNQAQYFGTLQKPFSSSPLHLLISRKFPNSKSLASNFNKTLKKLKSSKKYSKILANHLLTTKSVP